MEIPYDALILVSFGGPEGPDDVIPFLENVVRGRNVPRERLQEVAEHYQKFSGKSPINDQNRALVAALQIEFQSAGIRLPIYWGNRNWRPLLPDAVRQMADAGVRRALAFVTGAYSSYSGCRQYLENIDAARASVGPKAPAIEKLRAFFNHPGFIEAQVDLLRAAQLELPADRRERSRVLFTAHSIPQVMAVSCDYAAQLEESSRLTAEQCGVGDWRLVYQSRSGSPMQPWLEPDVCDAIRDAAAGDVSAVVLSPIGFLSDHIEILYDLDTQARAVCDELDLTMVRAATVGTHPRFVRMIRELVEERLDPAVSRPALGRFGPRADACAVDCCRFERRPPG